MGSFKLHPEQNNTVWILFALCCFTLDTNKPGLVKTLYHRSRNNRSLDALQDERSFLHATLVHNGYPAKFINA